MSLQLRFAFVLTLFSSFAFARGPDRPYDLLKTTPPSCERYLFGHQYGTNYAGKVFKAFRWLLDCRYDVEIKGLDEILARGSEGLIILPNHSGPIDPLVVVAALGEKLSVRPVMTEDMISGPMAPIMKAGLGKLNGFLLPNPARGGATSTGLTQAVFRELGNAAKHGDNVMIYPSGAIQLGPYERLGARKGAFMLTQANPDTRIVLLRERGFWGSDWTHGGESADPNHKMETGQIIGRGLKTGLKFYLHRLFHKLPKRKITLEFYEATDLPRGETATVAQVNDYLEKFYNATEEKRTFVRTYPSRTEPDESFGEPIDFSVAPPREEVIDDGESQRRAKPETVAKLVTLVKKELALEEASAQTNVFELADSMAKIDLDLAIGQEFGVDVPDDAKYTTVEDLALIIDEAAKHAEEDGPEKGSRFHASEGWIANASSTARVEVAEGTTIVNRVVKTALKNPNKVIGEDAVSGPMTYRRLLRDSLAISAVIERTVKGPRVGLMLPASTGGPKFWMGAHLAGKTPVMVNFTSAPRAVLESLNSIGVEKILTARSAFNEISKAYDLSPYMDRFIFIEDYKKQLMFEAVQATLNIKIAPKAILARTELTTDAAILFTSGSSGVPKAVPLTHENLLANVKDVAQVFQIHESDRLLCFLPPFHSFGNLLQVLSLTLGVPTVYHAKPQEGQTLAELIEAYGPTIMVGTPAFAEGIARKAEHAQVRSIRLLVTGAEALKKKLHDELKATFQNAAIVEGYGTTEMSPVVAVNPPEDARLGTVGKVLPSLKHAVLNPETLEPVAPGEIGTLVVAGGSRFAGYLNNDQDPFVKLTDGETYYNTGDLVREIDGYIKIEGRQSRYRKIAGEMVSLPELEDAVAELAETRRPNEGDGPSGPLVVVESKGDNEPLVLFTTARLSLAEVQNFMGERGFKGVRKISEVRKLDEMPMLGTGKADYKKLQGLLK